VPLGTYAHFADRDPLTRVVLEQMLAGVSTRRFARTREPVGEDVLGAERCTSKSAVSREFVGRTREHLQALMSRPLADIRLAALMLDGIELKGRCCVVALGVTTDGIKVPLGLWDGSTENKTIAAHLLSDLVQRPGSLSADASLIDTCGQSSPTSLILAASSREPVGRTRRVGVDVRGDD
jgi:transposase-like protein